MSEKLQLSNIQKITNPSQTVGEGRFQEIISLQQIKDTKTHIEYDGVIEKKLLQVINDLDESRNRLEKIRQEQSEEIELLTLAVNGLLAVNKLREKNLIYYDEE